MAGRINAYSLIRQIHLYSAFVTLTFLTMYFVTGFLMGKYQWFETQKPEPIISQLSITHSSFSEQDALVKHLQDTFNLNGRFTNHWENKGLPYYEFNSLKQNDIVWFDSLKTTAHLKTQPKNSYMAITAYHRAHKYGGGFAYNAYILLMDLASLALLLFVITGIYMWLNLVRYRWLGWGFLGLGVSYAIWVWLTFLDF